MNLQNKESGLILAKFCENKTASKINYFLDFLP
ncbi:hypothetical protein appser9_5160, partial [Actinobacillus pleuropneumoniae serovar 9 str. CVJ13261]